jgi:hypothetical protein
MNRYRLFLIGAVLSLFVVSCSLDKGSGDGSSGDSSSGTVTIKLSLSSSDKGASSAGLTNAIASSLADVYEVFFYSASGSVAFDSSVTSTSSAVSATLPVGAYTIVALAGNQDGTNASNAALLGTASQSVTIAAGANSAVTLTLQAVAQSLTVPSSATVDSTFSVALSFDAHIAAISMSAASPPRVYLTDENASAPAPTLSTSGTASVLTYSFTDSGGAAGNYYAEIANFMQGWTGSGDAPGCILYYGTTAMSSGNLKYNWSVLRTNDLDGTAASSAASQSFTLAAASGGTGSQGVGIAWGA